MSVDLQAAESAVYDLLLAVGENPRRSGLLDTPGRVARMYAEVLSGMDVDPADELVPLDGEHHFDPVILSNIEFHSVCEHHLVPFAGEASIAYLPQGKVCGLSKLVRLVDGYASRPQMQERLTYQVALAVEDRLNAEGVLVVVEAEHMCMATRGVRRPGAKTVTSSARGLYQQCTDRRMEMMSLMGFPRK